MTTYSFEGLDTSGVATMVEAMVCENDVVQLHALHAHIRGLEFTQSHSLGRAFVDVLLETDDYLDMALQVLDAAVVERWADSHVGTVVKQCPRLFERCAKPTGLYVYWLGRHWTDLDDAAKIGIFRGTSPHPAHIFLRNALEKDPVLWDHLTPLWFGRKSSELRQAATELGWRPNTRTGVMSTVLRAQQVHEWGAVLAYPHSMVVVASLLCKDRARVAQQQLSNMLGSGSGVEPSKQPPIHANQRDTTLAQMLVEKTKYPYELGEYAPTQSLPAHEMEMLQAIVNLHMDLDCLELLLHELEQDRLPGEMLGMLEGVGLPGDTYTLANLI